jgi:hypothetical protein
MEPSLSRILKTRLKRNKREGWVSYLGKKTSDEIFFKIKVKVPPEVGVYFGRPSIP